MDTFPQLIYFFFINNLDKANLRFFVLGAKETHQETGLRQRLWHSEELLGCLTPELCFVLT
jgi:hypothetical protein